MNHNIHSRLLYVTRVADILHKPNFSSQLFFNKHSPGCLTHVKNPILEKGGNGFADIY